MANSTIPNLVAVSVPALTDLFGVRQSGDTRDKKLTAAQLLSLGGDVTASGSPVNGEIPVWTSATDIKGSANDFVYNGSVFKVVCSTEMRLTGDLKLQTGSGQAPMLRDVAADETTPSLCPAVGDANTGIGWKSADRLALIAGGKRAMVLAESNSIGVIPAYDTGTGLTAFAGGGQGSAITLDRGYNVVTTVATTGDSAKLPTGLAFLQGSVVYLKNNGVNALDLFPGSGDNLGAGVDTAISVAAGASVAFIGTTEGSIWTQLIFAAGGGGGGDVTKVGTPVDNQIGVWTGDGTIEGDANFTWDGAHLLLPLNNDAVTPTLAFGDGNTGFYESADNNLRVSIGGVNQWQFVGTAFIGSNAAGPDMENNAPGATAPNIHCRTSDQDTGFGSSGLDALSFIAGGVEIARVQEAAAEQFIISPGALLGTAALPSLAFGDGDSGFRELSDDTLRVALAGVDRWTFTADRFVAVAGNGPSLQNEASTATNPTLIPALGDVSTGIGGVTTNLSLIVGGATRIQLNAAVSSGNTFTGDCQSANGTGWNLIDEAASSTNPTLCPRRGDEDSGIGQNAVDQVSLIAGGVEMLRVVEAVGIEQTLILNNDNTGLPDLGSLGDPDTGWHWTTANAMAWIGGGSRSWNLSTGLFFSQFSDGPAMVNVAAASATPTLLPDRADSDTGLGGDGSDKATIVAGGIVGISFKEVDLGVIQAPDASVGITAGAGGGLGNATLIRRSNNVITTVATIGDSVVLPTVFLVNAVVFIKNDGANAADVFPASGDNLGAGVDTAVSLASGESVSFIATVANSTWTPWIISVGGGGGGDVTKVGTPVNNQVGIWTGDGTLEGDADLTFDGTILTTGATGRIRTGFGSFSTPAFSFGSETNTGIYRQAAGSLGISLSGSGNYLFQAGSFFANIVGGPQMMVEASSATNPVFIPRLSDTDTGIGSGAADQMDLIAGALSCMAVRETGGARQIGFYTTAPISLQTGVAVDAAGIHAALVALGLITA